MSEVYESMEYIMEETSGMITKPTLNVHSQRLQSDNFLVQRFPILYVKKNYTKEL